MIRRRVLWARRTDMEEEPHLYSQSSEGKRDGVIREQCHLDEVPRHLLTKALDLPSIVASSSASSDLVSIRCISSRGY